MEKLIFEQMLKLTASVRCLIMIFEREREREKERGEREIEIRLKSGK